MKKLLIILTLLFISVVLFAFIAGGDIGVKHHDYTTYYNTATKEADSVSWTLTPTSVSCSVIARKNPFKMDPLIPKSASPNDYGVNSSDPKNPRYNPDRGAWIDEGHLFSYQSAMCSPFGVYECFYMSNMYPQFHAFNAGDWKTLEVQERVWAKTGTLREIAGGFGIMSQDTAKYGAYAVKLFPTGHLPAGEVIPAYMWKAISTNGGSYVVWIMPNCKHSVGHNFAYWKTNIKVFDLQSIYNEIKRLKI